MNRRDTIIVAVLINAGLLAVLFMLAVNPDDQMISSSLEAPKSKMAAHQSLSPTQQEEEIAFSQPNSSFDELDKALHDFAMNTPPEPVLIDEELLQTKKKAVDPNQSDYVEITVKRGDSLDKLARANATTVDAIRRANQLKSDVLRIGQVLRIPLIHTAQKEVQPTAYKPPATVTTKPIASVDPEYYVIKSGDNPWKISKQFKVKFDDLLRLNHLDEDSARALKPGDRIRVQ